MTLGGYVVVLFGDSEDEWCTLGRCPLGVAQWFPTRDDAEVFAEAVPPGMEPHIISVVRDEQFQNRLAPALGSHSSQGSAGESP